MQTPDPAPASEEFINYTIDATSYSYSAPTDTVKDVISSAENNTFIPTVRISCNGHDGNFTDLSFKKPGIALNSQQPLRHLGTTEVFGISNVLLGTSNVTITEYGAIGEFIAGNFSGLLFEGQSSSVTHNITCSFRVRRTE